MGTRSVVAVPTENGFKGRYIHWDGYPSGVGVALRKIVKRDGLSKAIKTLTEDNYAWSGVDSTTKSDPENASVVPGYGQTSQTEKEKDWWVTEDGDDCGTEWAYVLGEGSLVVFERSRPDGQHMTGMFGVGSDTATWVKRGSLPYREKTPDEALVRLECGEDLERCTHYAWAHDLLPRDSNLSTRAFLGHAPLGFRDATSVVYGGSRQRLTRSGGTGTAHSSRYNPLTANNYWWGDTEDSTVRLARILKDGSYKIDHDLVLPATKVAPEIVVPAGTVLR